MQTDRQTLTYGRTYGRGHDPFPATAPIRTVREQLEGIARLDLRDESRRWEFGDLHLTVRRSDWSVYVELQVHVYDDEPETLEEI